MTGGTAEDAEPSPKSPSLSRAQLDRLTGDVIGAAIRVHCALGPGLLENAYEACLAHALRRSGLQVERQLDLPVHFEGLSVGLAYRIDLLVERAVVVELKAVERLNPVHEAQILSHLRLSGYRVGLLMNFNCRRLKDGIRRFVNQF